MGCDTGGKAQLCIRSKDELIAGYEHESAEVNWLKRIGRSESVEVN